MVKNAKNFFSDEQVEEIKQSILNAELDTSGEIRVHIENKCEGEVLDRAAQVFKTLEMQDTELRNGVLIYLAVKNRKFAIIGDSGINAVVEKDYWERIKARMLNDFRENHFTEGLSTAILEVGKVLKTRFPRQLDDQNELSDEISFGSDS
ncbi:MAG: TPM domain-containing protein [Bacteroidales bacterium]|nr:TPM domain-containing protein [Bacteroidales bacterium]